jgi:AcrR family transcriptional regulator
MGRSSETTAAATGQTRPARSRARKDSRREATRLAILNKAEELIAEFGVDAVSLRQIGAAIGSANTNVVTYYFGSKAGLIKEIFAARLPRIESRRAELFAQLNQNGEGYSIDGLTDAQWRPLFELKNDKGRHSFAGFMNTLGRSAWVPALGHVDGAFPVTTEILRRLGEPFPKHAFQLYRTRLRVCTLMVTGALEHIDSAFPNDPVLSKAIFEDAVRMAAAAMKAPIE